MPAISSRCNIPMLSASRRARGFALVVVEVDSVQRRMEELVGRELVELADFLEPYVFEAAHTSSKGIRILDRRKHGSTALANSCDGKHLFGPWNGGSRQPRRRACGRGIGVGRIRYNRHLPAAADEGFVRNKGHVTVGLSLLGSGSRSKMHLHHPLLDSQLVGFVKVAVELAACLVGVGIMPGSTLAVSKESSSKDSCWPMNLGSNMKSL